MTSPRNPLAILAAATLLMATLSLPSLAETLTPIQQRGRVLAQGMCGGCHAIDKAGDSPHPAAPRFRVLDRQTDLDKLATRLREGLLTGHEDMPMFRFDRDDANAMVAYLRQLQGP